MIRASAGSSAGPIVFLGLTAENVRRLKEGQPIDVDLRPLLRAAGGNPASARVVISYGETHVAVVQDMQAGGLEMPQALLDHAHELDESL